MQLGRVNCRLASTASLAEMSKVFKMEDKWEFIQTRLAKKIPLTTALDMPKSLITKDDSRRVVWASTC